MTQITDGDGQIFTSHCSRSAFSEKKTEEDTERWFAKRPRTEYDKAGEASCSEPLLRCTATLQPAGGSNGTSLGDDDDEGSTSYVVKRISAFLNETEPYILDIDLDFFSCKNPFKELYTQVHPTHTPLPHCLVPKQLLYAHVIAFTLLHRHVFHQLSAFASAFI